LTIWLFLSIFGLKMHPLDERNRTDRKIGGGRKRDPGSQGAASVPPGAALVPFGAAEFSKYVADIAGEIGCGPPRCGTRGFSVFVFGFRWLILGSERHSWGYFRKGAF
jgi:hypothetical protein